MRRQHQVVLTLLVLTSMFLAGCSAPDSGLEQTAIAQGNGNQGPPGIEWRGTWAADAAYFATDAVHHEGSTYVALASSTGVPPGTDPSKWDLVALKGDTGATGPQGPAGPTGPQGETGATGPAGPVGPAGETGPQGPQGFVGPAGPPGPTGPTGATGPAGAPGPVVTWRGAWDAATAYAKYDVVSHQGGSWLLVAATSTNEAPDATPASWVLLARKGDTGPQGVQGPQGLQGIQGETGPQGPQGETGATGATGPQGPQGIQGETGPQGLQGVQGMQGPIGPAGMTWRGAWSASTAYVTTDGVEHDGSSYIALADSTNVAPGTDAAKWSLLAQKGTAPVGGWSVADGGTGLTAAATGDLLYASATDTYARLPAAASGNVLLSGTTPSWGKVGLTTHVSGTLPATSGGTGIGWYGTGDLLYASNANALARLPATAAGSVLLSGSSPSWGKVDMSSAVAGILQGENGGTGANDVQFTKSGSMLRTYTVPDVSGTLSLLNTAQTWSAAQFFFQGISLNALARTGNYSMSNTDSVILMAPDAATQWVELPCAVTVGAGRLAVVKKMNTLYSIYIAGCPPGTEKIDNQNTLTIPSAYRGSVILISRGTSNGWIVAASHGLSED